MEKKSLTQNEKLAHYRGIANGSKPVNSDSKYSAIEQMAYARGQRDARNEARKLWALKNKKK